MAKITELDALTAPLDTDFLVLVDESTAVTKRMEIQYLLVALDGDHLDVTFTPTYYTPASTPAEADDVNDLAAHLYGIDQQLVGIPFKSCTDSTTFTVTQKYIDVDTNGGAITGTLPSAATAGAGYNYIFKLSDATAVFTLATNGAETIDGAGGWQLTKKDEYFEIISDGTNWKVLRWDAQRPVTHSKFAYSNATRYTVEAGCYELPSSQFKKVYWSALLWMGPAYWAAGSTGIATTGFHYLYLDQSAIDAGNTPQIQDSHFISVTTAPSWDSDFGGWYNGNDRCIWAVRFSAASTLANFIHDGNTVSWIGEVSILANTDIDTTWTDVTLKMPGFCRRGDVYFRTTTNAHLVRHLGFWRTNGQSGNGYEVYSTYFFGDNSVNIEIGNTVEVLADSAQKIEVRHDTAGTTTMKALQSNYKLPRGI